MNNNSNNSSRNINESIFTQEYAGFFNDWRNMRSYCQPKSNQMSERKNTGNFGYGTYQDKKSSGFDIRNFDIDLNRVYFFLFYIFDKVIFTIF